MSADLSPEEKHVAAKEEAAQLIHEHQGFNRSLAIFLTKIVGTIWCAYFFAFIALLGLPAALSPGGQGPVAWFAQTFLQLVLLSIIMVGSNVLQQADEARAEADFEVNRKAEEEIENLLQRVLAIEQQVKTTEEHILAAVRQ